MRETANNVIDSQSCYSQNSYKLLYLTVKLYDICTARAIAFYTEGGKAGPERATPPVTNEQLSSIETERRIKLLQENR